MTSNNVVKTFNGNVAVNGLIIQRGGWREVPFTFSVGTKASTATVDSLRYTVIGDTAIFHGYYHQPDNTGAADGSGSYSITLPIECDIGPTGSGVIGFGTLVAGAATFCCAIELAVGNLLQVRVLEPTDDTSYIWGSGNLGLDTAGVTQLKFTAMCQVDVDLF